MHSPWRIHFPPQQSQHSDDYDHQPQLHHPLPAAIWPWRAAAFRTALLDVSYFGTKGTHLLTQTNINQPPATTLSTAAVNLLRPFPAYGNITDYLSSAASNYNALEVKLDKRLSHGLNALISYTYSKSLDDALGSNPQNANNLSAEYGNSVFDARHRLVVSGLYRLPFGPDGQWVRNGLESHIVEGWELSGILSVQTGHYLLNCNCRTSATRTTPLTART